MQNTTALSHQSLFNFVISLEYANMTMLASINMRLEDAHLFAYSIGKIIDKGKRDAEY
jgi:hypothetical protein